MKELLELLYRVCMAPSVRGGYRVDSLRHRFVLGSSETAWSLVRDRCCEEVPA